MKYPEESNQFSDKKQVDDFQRLGGGEKMRSHCSMGLEFPFRVKKCFGSMERDGGCTTL